MRSIAIALLGVIGLGCPYIDIEERSEALEDITTDLGHEYGAPASICGYWEGDYDPAYGMPADGWRVDGPIIAFGRAQLDNWAPGSNPFPANPDHLGGFALSGPVAEDCGVSALSAWTYQGNRVTWSGVYGDDVDLTATGNLHDACGWFGEEVSANLYCRPDLPEPQWVIEATLTDASPGTWGDGEQCPEKYNVVIRRVSGTRGCP